MILHYNCRSRYKRVEQELRCLEEEVKDRAEQEALSRRGAARHSPATTDSQSPAATSTPSHAQVPLGPAWAGTEEGSRFFQEAFAREDREDGGKGNGAVLAEVVEPIGEEHAATGRCKTTTHECVSPKGQEIIDFLMIRIENHLQNSRATAPH